MLTRREIVTVILLSIVTCGIYSIYWTYVTMEALDREGQSSNMPVIAQFLLALFLGSVGYLLFGMNANANLNAIRARRGYPQKDDQVLYMILGFVIPIVLVCMVQDEINKLA